MLVLLSCLISLFSLETARSAAPVLVEPDEAAKNNSGVQISAGWTTRYTPRPPSGSNDYTEADCNVAAPAFQARPNLYNGNDFTTSGFGYGADGGDQGASEYLEFTTAANVQSVSAFFLNYRDGQIADIYVDGSKVRSVNTFSTGGTPSGATEGVCGQLMEEVLTTGLSAGAHTIRIVNTGTVNGPIAYSGRTDRGLGRQVILDCFRTGDFDFGTVEGVVRDRAGNPIPMLRMLIDTSIGPILSNGKTVFYSNGDGKFRISGLARGSQYTIAADDRRANFSETVAIPTDNDGVLVKNFTAAGNIDILRPRVGLPAIVERGGTFTLEVDADAASTNWTAKLKHPDITVDLPIVSAAYTTKGIYNKTRDGWVITCSIPGSGITLENTGAPCELFDLELACNTGTRLEPHAVSVIEDAATSFYTAQFTDVHVAGGAANLQKGLAVLDIIAPRFIAVTGDTVQLPGQPQVFEEFHRIMRSEAKAPSVITTGNHDVTTNYDAFQQNTWDNLFAQSEFSFRSGPVYVMVHNVTTLTSKWADAEWSSAYANPNDKVRIVLEHTPNSFQQFVPPAGKPATILLAGHNHADTANLINGTIAVTTKATIGSRLCRIARFDCNDSGQWSLRGFAYPNRTFVPGAGENTYPSFPLYISDTSNVANVTRTFSSPNNGTATSNQATIQNNSLEPLEYCRARFVMAPGEYRVAGGFGRIIDSYNSLNGTTIVQAEIPVAAQSSATLTIGKKVLNTAVKRWTMLR